MNAVILGIFTKTAFLTLGLIGLWLVLIRCAQGRGRGQFLPPAILKPWEFYLPMRADACRLINLPSRAPPGMISRRQAAMVRAGLC